MVSWNREKALQLCFAGGLSFGIVLQHGLTDMYCACGHAPLCVFYISYVRTSSTIPIIQSPSSARLLALEPRHHLPPPRFLVVCQHPQLAAVPPALSAVPHQAIPQYL